MVLNKFWDATSYRQNVIQMSNAITQKTIVHQSVQHVSDKPQFVLSSHFLFLNIGLNVWALFSFIAVLFNWHTTTLYTIFVISRCHCGRPAAPSDITAMRYMTPWQSLYCAYSLCSVVHNPAISDRATTDLHKDGRFISCGDSMEQLGLKAKEEFLETSQQHQATLKTPQRETLKGHFIQVPKGTIAPWCLVKHDRKSSPLCWKRCQLMRCSNHIFWDW